MAWWTHLIFFTNDAEYERGGETQEETFLAVLRRALREEMKKRCSAAVHFVLSSLIYLYLIFVAAVFLLQEYAPRSFYYAAEAFSEPYLGLLGIYAIFKGIQKRQGCEKKSPADFFATAWFIFFLAATFLTFFSGYYHFSGMYKNVTTNALAAIIIRVGTVLATLK